MSDELTELMEWFDDDQQDLQEAITKYRQASNLISQMEKYLKTAENRIKKINLSPDR